MQPNPFELNNLAKRRAWDSNPQPLAGHLISSQAAGQFAYPPDTVNLLSKARFGQPPCGVQDAFRMGPSARITGAASDMRPAPNDCLAVSRARAGVARCRRHARQRRHSATRARLANRPEKPLQADRIDPLLLPSVSACALAAHVRVLAVSIAVSTRGKCLPHQRLARRYPRLVAFQRRPRGKLPTMAKDTFRIVTRGTDGKLHIRDYSKQESLLRVHTQIGVDDCSTDLGLRGLPVFRGLIGPMPEGKNVIRYESPEVFETLTKEWGRLQVASPGADAGPLGDFGDLDLCADGCALPTRNAEQSCSAFRFDAKVAGPIARSAVLAAQLQSAAPIGSRPSRGGSLSGAAEWSTRCEPRSACRGPSCRSQRDAPSSSSAYRVL